VTRGGACGGVDGTRDHGTHRRARDQLEPVAAQELLVRPLPGDVARAPKNECGLG